MRSEAVLSDPSDPSEKKQEEEKAVKPSPLKGFFTSPRVRKDGNCLRDVDRLGRRCPPGWRELRSPSKRRRISLPRDQHFFLPAFFATFFAGFFAAFFAIPVTPFIPLLRLHRRLPNEVLRANGHLLPNRPGSSLPRTKRTSEKVTRSAKLAETLQQVRSQLLLDGLLRLTHCSHPFLPFKVGRCGSGLVLRIFHLL